MPRVSLGEYLDAQMREDGYFTLSNLDGSVLTTYRYGRRQSTQVFCPTRETPNLLALRDFLITQARLGPT